jgi:hypothetical protein
MLVIAALAGYRNREGITFSITALVRHNKLAYMARALGADHVTFIDSDYNKLANTFDIVYDTTGKA